jgi:hypothetical protein
MLKELWGRLLTALKNVKWRWFFIYPIYTVLVYFRVLKLKGSPFLGAAVLCLGLLVVNHFVRKIE